jgi:hypothetical protein
MQNDTVRWELLPHDPLGFFGLASGFDRKDLKRAYGKLIRIYKPESSPQEFQRIREAYEELESQYRYGVQAQVSNQLLNAWSQIAKNDASTTSSSKVSSDLAASGSAGESQTTSIQELACKNPVEAYKRLAANNDKSPQDFFLIAILADVVDRTDPQRFLKWLLTGIKQFPTDPGLGRLIREHLTSDVDSATASSVLTTLSKIVSGDVFFQLTEPLWGRLLKDYSFEKFSKLLETCESNFQRGAVQAKLVFYVHILRLSLWRANVQWFEKHWSFVQQHGSELPAGLEPDIEMLTLIREYFMRDRPKSESDPIRKQIDEMIRSYCEDPWLVSTAKIAQVQNEIARNSNAFMDAFQAKESETDHRILSLCALLAYEVSEQTGLSYDAHVGEGLTRQADQTVADLRNESERVWAKITWMMWRLNLIAYSLLVLLPLVFLWGWFSRETMLVIVVAWLILGTLIHFAVVKQFYLNEQSKRGTQRIAIAAYEGVWRPRLFRYVQSCHVSPHDAMETLQKSGYHVGDQQLVGIVLSYAQADFGLRIFHTAQQFMH